MIGWGIVSGCFAFTQGPISFFILRFTLGLADARFFPGMILYFTYWFPTHHRAHIVAGFMAAIPVSIGLGAPVSTAFLQLAQQPVQRRRRVRKPALFPHLAPQAGRRH